MLPEWTATMSDAKLDELRHWLNGIFKAYDTENANKAARISALEKSVNNLYDQDTQYDTNFEGLAENNRRIENWASSVNQAKDDLEGELHIAKVTMADYVEKLEHVVSENREALVKLANLEVKTGEDLDKLKANLDDYTKKLESTIGETTESIRNIEGKMGNGDGNVTRNIQNTADIKKLEETITNTQREFQEAKAIFRKNTKITDDAVGDLRKLVKDNSNTGFTKKGKKNDSSDSENEDNYVRQLKVRADMVDAQLGHLEQQVKIMREEFEVSRWDPIPSQTASQTVSQTAAASGAGAHGQCPCVILDHESRIQGLEGRAIGEHRGEPEEPRGTCSHEGPGGDGGHGVEHYPNCPNCHCEHVEYLIYNFRHIDFKVQNIINRLNMNGPNLIESYDMATPCGGAAGPVEQPPGIHPGCGHGGHGGGHGGGGHGGGHGGGSGGGPSGGPGHHDHAGAEGPARLGPFPRIFDDKVPTFAEFRYDGVNGGDAWRRKVRGYWVSKVPSLQVVLNIVEKAEGEVTHDSIIRSLPDRMHDFNMSNDIITVSALCWGFLNTAVHSAAVDVMKAASELNGMEAWRLLCRHIDHGRPLRLDVLRRQLRAPSTIKSLADVPTALTRFQNLVREFEDAGGDRPPDSSLKSDLFEMLPGQLRDQLLWHASDPTWSFQKFKDHVSTTAERVMHYSSKLPVNVVEQQHDNKAMIAKLEETMGVNNLEELIAALKSRDQRPRQQQAPKVGAEIRCGNCGMKGHSSQECRKPKVPLSERPCFLCGKPGHTARYCPQAPPTQHGGIKIVEEQDENWVGAVCRPATTLGDVINPAMRRFCAKNRYQALAQENDSDVESEPEMSSDEYEWVESDAEDDSPHSHSLGAICSEESGSGWCRPPDEPALGETPGAWIKATGVAEAGTSEDEWPTLFESFPAGIVSRRRQPSVYAVSVTSNNSNSDNSGNPYYMYAYTGREGAVAETGMVGHADECEINGADEERTVGIAMDSGAVDHVIGPKDLPPTAQITPLSGNRIGKTLVAANGEPLEMHGECCLEMEPVDNDDKTCGGSFAVTEVTRTLQSTSRTCDQGLGCFFDKDICKVVDSETVAAINRLIDSRKNSVKAKFPRSGGLYVRRAKLRKFQPRQATTQPQRPQPARPQQATTQPQRPRPARPQSTRPQQQQQRNGNGRIPDFTRPGNRR